MNLTELFKENITTYTKEELVLWITKHIGGFENSPSDLQKYFALGQVPEEFVDFLFFLKSLNIRSFLEIGTSLGGSCLLISYFLKQTLRKTVTIDLYTIKFYPQIKEKIDFIKGFGIECRYIMTLSDFFFYNCKENYDLIFIDGNHLYNFVKRDFENAKKYLNDGGIIAFHDANAIDCQPVKRLWNEIKTKNCLEFFHPNEKCGIGIWKR